MAWTLGAGRWRRASLGHGTDVGPAQGGQQCDGEPARVGVQRDQAKILDELCELTWWHWDHAREVFREALGPRRVPEPRKARPPTADHRPTERMRWGVAPGVGGVGRPGG